VVGKNKKGIEFPFGRKPGNMRGGAGFQLGQKAGVAEKLFGKGEKNDTPALRPGSLAGVREPRSQDHRPVGRAGHARKRKGAQMLQVEKGEKF